jgi:pyridoxamine 5'-phosphate oxidase
MARVFIPPLLQPPEPPPERPFTDPIRRFGDAFAKALSRAPEIGDACVLSTTTADGMPSGRVVLLKSFDERGFVFFTNLSSRKAQDLLQNPRAALTSFWPDVGEQIRVERVVQAVAEDEAHAYFRTRPRLSQIGAWASQQSEALPSRALLNDRVASLMREFEGREIPCPPQCGGLRVVPERIEFWEAEAHRLHTRELYTHTDGRWAAGLLFP